jgi:hypothetical protein
MSPRARASAIVPLVLVAILAAGCPDQVECGGEESFVVDENGTCSATPQRFTLERSGCGVFLQGADAGATGLPAEGAVANDQRPLRQGGFILYGGSAGFRLCRATRVQFQLDLACEDGSGAPVCDAVLTEPSP